MPVFNPHEIIPKAYEGREQAYIKHLLLEGYLERLFRIIGWNASQLRHSEVVYVDCFAGPWKDESSDLSATSIGISLRLLSKIQEDLSKVGQVVKFRALYVEKNKTAFSRLSSYLSTQSPTNVSTEAISGDFSEKVPDILQRCSGNSFAFFFIDPKGWSTVKPNILDSLLKRPHSEFLINFMYDFVNRTVSMAELQAEMAELFDQPVDIDDLPKEPSERERHILEMYRSAVVGRASTSKFGALSGYVTILDPLKDRTKYHLIYLTRHPLGLIEFMKQSEKLDTIQATVRASAKIKNKSKNSGTNDMFGADHNQAFEKQVDWNSLEKYWLDLLGDKEIAVTDTIFANALSQTNAFPSELQEALKGLAERALVINLDGDISRRKKNVVDLKNVERWRRTHG